MLGFTRLLASVEDLALDFPDAAHTLSLFLGRAVVDEALPPSFLAAVLTSLRYDSLGVAVVHATGARQPWLPLVLRSGRHADGRGGLQRLVVHLVADQRGQRAGRSHCSPPVSGGQRTGGRQTTVRTALIMKRR